jgi:hypothetical protein
VDSTTSLPACGKRVGDFQPVLEADLVRARRRFPEVDDVRRRIGDTRVSMTALRGQ